MYIFLETVQIHQGRNKIMLFSNELILCYEPKLVELAELPWGTMHVTR